MSHNQGDEDDQKGYTWEAGYADGLNIREVLQEDEGGSVEKAIGRLIVDARKKQRAKEKPARVRLGIMRYVYVVLDCSRFMASNSMPPSRLRVALSALDSFLDKFFEQNPIAQVGIILCKDKKAERYVPLTGNIRQLKEAMAVVVETQCAGDFSLQNGLQLALTNLQDLPGHVSREVLVMAAAYATVDPGSIFVTMDALKAANVRCSVVGMGAEVFVYKQVSKVTNGRYDIAMDEEHTRLLMAAHTVPPPTSKNVECNAVRVGFPAHQEIHFPSFCQCHPDSAPLSSRGYLCVQCGARLCSLPVECRVCRLTLVTAPQLARAFRHLLPLAAFEAVDEAAPGPSNGHAASASAAKTEPEAAAASECFACSCSLESGAYACKLCRTRFCFDCDILLHDSLNLCPGCP